ncbi:hypothetical protein NQ314_019754 [Rhamnusium bicolor]|uniref:Uncharacterized protein n=1 Tax=Rhamnusium bicolor TaxID=1586634 RepID=A0AAV8WN74_9CUCU|nr:hypothetical protein NQ314_019754 [Rhamnusium bicolor]
MNCWLEARFLQVSHVVPSRFHCGGPANLAGYSSAKTAEASLWHPYCGVSQGSKTGKPNIFLKVTLNMNFTYILCTLKKRVEPYDPYNTGRLNLHNGVDR